MNFFDQFLLQCFSGSSPGLVLLNMILKVTILLGTVTLITALIQKVSVTTRHLLWILSFMGLVLLPLFSYLLPELHLHILKPDNHQPVKQISSQINEMQTDENTGKISMSRLEMNNSLDPVKLSDQTANYPSSNIDTKKKSASAQDEASSRVTVPTVIMIILITGTAGFLIKAALGLNGAYYIARSAERVEDLHIKAVFKHAVKTIGLNKTNISLLKSKCIYAPVTLGIFHNKILLPYDIKEWSEDRLRAVLLHELAHIKRYDFLYNILSILVISLYWFHPLAWHAYHRIGTEREQACDDYVIKAGIKPTDYAQYLFSVLSSLRSRRLPAISVVVSMARWTHIESRIRAVLDTHHQRRILKPVSRVWLSFVLLMLVLPLAALKPVTKKAVRKTETQSFQTIFHSNVIKNGELDLIDTPVIFDEKNKFPSHEVRDGNNRDDNGTLKNEYNNIQQKEIKTDKLYQEILGEYFAEIEMVFELFSIVLKNGELWGTRKSENDSKRLILITKDPLKFLIEGESYTAAFQRNNKGQITQCSLIDQVSGENYICKKIDNGRDDPDKNRKRKKLYNELEGKYLFDDKKSGLAGIATISLRDEELWGSLGNKYAEGRLYKVSEEELQFFVLGESIMVTFLRNGNGEINQLKGHIKNEGTIILAEKIMRTAIDYSKLQNFYESAAGKYIIHIQNHTEMITLFRKDNELWGMLTESGDPQKLDLIDANSLKFIIADIGLTGTFQTNSQGEITHGSIKDLTSGRTGTFTKITLDENNPEVKEKLRELYSDLSGQYYFEKIINGESDIIKVSVQDDKLWYTFVNANESGRLYPESIA